MYLIRSADGDVSVNGNEHGDEDGAGLSDERHGEDVDQDELVERAELLVAAVQARVLDECRQKVQREGCHQQ